MLDINGVLDRYANAVSRRTKYNSVMREAGQYAWPDAQEMVFTPEMTEGDIKTVELYDSTAVLAAYRMTAGIFTYLMPMGARWFGFVARLPDDNNNPVIQEWLSTATALTHKEIWRSNFQREMFLTIRSMIVFGTGVISVEKIGDEIIFKNHPIGSTFFEENSKGDIDTVYRQIFYTARQAEQEFGYKNLSKSVKKAFDNGKLNEKFEFAHACAPNKDFNPDRTSSRSKRTRSLYICIQDRKEVKDGGFDELPYFTARFSKVPGEIMGRGPAIEYLPEIKMLNRMKKTFIESSEKAANPPLVVEDDGVVGQPVTSPSGMIYVRAGALDPHALDTKVNVQLNAEIIAQQQQFVKEGFFNDLFQSLVGHKNMTAFEAGIRKEDDMTIISPAINSLNKEILNRIILRTLKLAIKAKSIPEPPVDLENLDLNIVYQGRLALAMSNVQTNAIEIILSKWAPYAEAFPVFDNVNWDDSFRLAWINSGAPAEGLKEPEKRDEEREEVKQLQKAAAEAEIGETASKAYRNVSKSPEAGSIAESL